MSSGLDSVAVFRSRLEDKNCGFLIERFAKKNIHTLGELAFSTSYMPGTGDEAIFKQEVLGGVLDVNKEEESKLVGIVRRLFFEAFTMSTFNLRQELERKGDSQPQPLNTVERLERRKAFEKAHGDRGPGYWATDRMASDDLLDAYVQMWDLRDITFVPWAERTNQKFMRDHAPRKDKKRTLSEFYTDDRGKLTAMDVEEKPEDPLHVGSPDFALRWDRMMERNAMAVDMAQIMSFAAHEKIRFFLEAARTEELADPRWMPVSWDQILSAEREIWKQLGDRLGREVRARDGGAPPADAILDAILESKRVTHILANTMRPAKIPSQPGQPKTTPDKPTGHGKGTDVSKAEQLKRKRQSEEDKAKHLARVAAGGKDPAKGLGKQARKGKEKDMTKAKKDRAPRPKALAGHEIKLGNGEPLCWSYNLSSCSGAADGGKCNKGHHLCARKGCGFQPHPFKDCPHK